MKCGHIQPLYPMKLGEGVVLGKIYGEMEEGNWTLWVISATHMCRVGVGVIHWNMGDLPVATPSRKNESPSPSSCQQPTEPS